MILFAQCTVYNYFLNFRSGLVEQSERTNPETAKEMIPTGQGTNIKHDDRYSIFRAV